MQIVNSGLIYSDDRPGNQERVACFPSLTRLCDGRILCTFKVGSTKESADETLRIAESFDDGLTWRLTSFAPDTSLEGIPGSLRIAHLAETRPNHLMVVTNWVRRDDASLPICHPLTGGCLELRVIVFRSSDGGKTWGEAEDITGCSPFDQPEVSGPIVQLAQQGHFLLPMENQKRYDDPADIDEKAFALLSSDFGLTWNDWAMIAHRFPKYKHWGNRVARFPESDRLICCSWTYDEESQQDLPIHLIFGSADGRDWSEPLSTGIEGQLSNPLPIDPTTLILSYVHRHQPPSMRLRRSNDGGKTWDADEELIIFTGEADAPTDGRGGGIADYYRFLTHYTFGWPQLLQLNNGRILVAYFAGSPEQMDIHFTIISL